MQKIVYIVISLFILSACDNSNQQMKSRRTSQPSSMDNTNNQDDNPSQRNEQDGNVSEYDQNNNSNSNNNTNTEDGEGDSQNNEMSDVATDAEIVEVFIAQKHVQPIDDEKLKLVGDLAALIKVHVVSQTAGKSPAVYAELTLNGQQQRIELKGPGTLPKNFESGKGKVIHSKNDNSFTAVLPEGLIRPGLKLKVLVGDESKEYDIQVGAPTELKMHMYEVHWFGEGNKTYADNFLDEFAAKIPVKNIELKRIKNINFPTLISLPREGHPALRVTSKEDYKAKTGINYDGEQGIALKWNSALAAAGNQHKLSLSYLSINGVPSGGQAGGFKGVGQQGAHGIFLHELGHAFSLPHLGDHSPYPYKGEMHGVPAPDNYKETHVGPNWGFHLPTLDYLPSIVMEGETRNKPVGTYKIDPMQGGGEGWQPEGFIYNHFSDWSVNKMQDYIEGFFVRYDKDNKTYSKWNQNEGGYEEFFEYQNFQNEVEVISVLVNLSRASPEANFVYQPIGPYVSGLPALKTTGDGEFKLEITQGNKQKNVILNTVINVTDPLDPKSLYAQAVNLPAEDGTITKVVLRDMKNNNRVLHTWEGASNQGEFSVEKTKELNLGSSNTSDGQSDENKKDDTASKSELKVYLLAGQSNMVGKGQIYDYGKLGTLEHLIKDDPGTYGYLGEHGNWNTRSDVHYLNLGDGPQYEGPLTVNIYNKKEIHSTFGPELAFGNIIGDHFDDDVVIIKTAWGGKSLFADFRPPSSGGDTGTFYTTMVNKIDEALGKYKNESYQLMGFGWHQGWNDGGSFDHVNQYEENLVNLIRDLRSKFCKFPVVVASSGFGGHEETNARRVGIMEAQLAVDGKANNYPDFINNTAAIDTRSFWREPDISPSAQSYHWWRNAETYYLIGKSMADKMIELNETQHDAACRHTPSN